MIFIIKNLNKNNKLININKKNDKNILKEEFNLHNSINYLL